MIKTSRDKYIYIYIISGLERTFELFIHVCIYIWKNTDKIPFTLNQ